MAVSLGNGGVVLGGRAWFLMLCTLGSFVLSVHSFSEGPPDKSCFTLYPKHDDTDAMSTPAPYQVIVNVSSYTSMNQPIEITLQSEPGHHFKGFMLVASRFYGGEASVEEVVGDFVVASDKGQFLKWYPSNQNQSNCIAHKNSQSVESLTVTWLSPDPAQAGDVVFRASFLSEYYEFWVDVRSEVITTSLRLDTIHSMKPPVETVVGIPADITRGCGGSKGCVGFPRHCSGDDCLHVVTWTPGADHVKFEIISETQDYVSIAVSQDETMGDDHTMTCVSKNHFMHIQSGYNPGYYNERHIIDQFWDLQVTRDDGRLYCSWRQNYQVNLTLMDLYTKVLSYKTYDYRERWYIHMAWGNVLYGGDTLAKHQEYPVVTHHKVSFDKTEGSLAYGLPLMQKLHGFLMILAWILCCGVGVVSSRYLKDAFGNKTIKGAKVWFQIHRAVMIVCGAFTIIAFVLIFVSLKKWSEYNSDHAIVGTVMTGLMLVQILMGLVRPGPSSKLRPAFNWVHWGLGKGTQILSAAAMFLSLYSVRIFAQLRNDLLIVFSTWVGVQVLFELVGFEIPTCSGGEGKSALLLLVRRDNYELEHPTKKSPEADDARAENGLFLKIQFILYLLVIVALTIAACAILFLY